MTEEITKILMSCHQTINLESKVVNYVIKTFILFVHEVDQRRDCRKKCAE